MSVRDTLTVLGTVAVTIGCGLISAALGFVAFGIILLYLGR